MPTGYHHVTRDIRCQIYALKSTNTPLHKISDLVNRDVSTISREINRNTGGRGYRYKQADEKATERRVAASHAPKKLTPALIEIIEKYLLEDWSPDQISGRLRLEGQFIGESTEGTSPSAARRTGRDTLASSGSH